MRTALRQPHFAIDAVGVSSLPADAAPCSLSRNTLPMCRFGLALGQLELGVLEIDQRLAERLALLDVLVVTASARSMTATRRTATMQALLRQLLHDLDEPLPSSMPIRFDVGTRTSSKNSSAVSFACWPIFSSIAPAAKSFDLVRLHA